MSTARNSRPAVFDSELEMHSWLRGQLKHSDGLAALVLNGDYLDECRPKSYAECKLLDSYRLAWRSLTFNHVMTDNQNISLKPGEVMRPDFLLYGTESETIAVVELKNDASATRQGGTELHAYAAGVQNHLPLLADGDIANILISTSWPTLLRRYVSNEALWIGRAVLCLEPVWTEKKKRRLRIKTLRAIIGDEADKRLAPESLGGFCLCLYDYANQTATKSATAHHIRRMRTAGLAMAARGNALRGHGFAFLWKDRRPNIAAPYCFTIVNIAAFQVSKRSSPGRPASEARERFLEVQRRFDPQGHGVTISEIQRCGQRYLKPWFSPQVEGFMDWGSLRKDMQLYKESVLGFYAWGLFGEDFQRRLQETLSARVGCPDWDDWKIGWKVVQGLIEVDP